MNSLSSAGVSGARARAWEGPGVPDCEHEGAGVWSSGLRGSEGSGAGVLDFEVLRGLGLGFRDLKGFERWGLEFWTSRF